MKGLILAGGEGRRLRPLTYSIPKQLVPVANRPIIHYVVDQIRRGGIVEVGVIISPHTGDQIREALKAETGMDFTFIIQEKPLGLAHAVMTAKEFLGNDDFLMYLGDNLIGESIGELIRSFNSENEDGIILLKEVPDPRVFGVAVTDGNGRVIRLIEKPEEPPSKLALVGVYFFTPKIHDAIASIRPSDRGELEITDAISVMIQNRAKIRSVLLQDFWLDTGKKDDLLAANRLILERYGERILTGDIEDSKIEGKVELAPGAVVRKSRITGPVVIGKDAVITGSDIGPFTAIGSGCLIEDSRIEACLVMELAKIKGIPCLFDSIIGKRAKVERGKAKGQTLLIGDDAEIRL
ncbi:MAG TPA: glucose-1-phosphate thymidylyltransferase [bacterium (Candidatus Stahlbacteria)]|nr:glucose-1-phosphate thymidylyltransferase [Candidatus Stahlbacteria bacterium]